MTEFTWQEKGALLALAIGADDKTGNGVQLYDPETGSLRVLDSATAIYSGLTWRKDANDLAVLRSATDDRHEGPTQVLLAWPSARPDGALRPDLGARLPRRFAHRVLPPAVVVRRWPDRVRGRGAMGREAEDGSQGRRQAQRQRRGELARQER